MHLTISLLSILKEDRMKINTKSKAMVLSQKTVGCSLQVIRETLPLVEEYLYNYLGWSIVVKQEISFLTHICLPVSLQPITHLC